MGCRKATTYLPPPPPRKGVLVRAVELMSLVSSMEETPYLRPYREIAEAFLEIRVRDWPERSRSRPVGDFDWFPADAAMWWIGRIRDRDLLASILTTEALHRLSRIASAIGDRDREFPASTDKRDLTRARGEYWIEFTVPEGAALDHGDDRLGPGYQAIALVERCHLSENIYHAPRFTGVVPGFGECRSLLGFDLPCQVFPGHRFEEDDLVGEDLFAASFTSYGVMCNIPFGFVTGSRQRDWERRDRPYPLCPMPGLDEMVKLIEEVARTPEEAVTTRPAEGPDPPKLT